MIGVSAARETIRKKYESSFAGWATALAVPNLPGAAPDTATAHLELPLHPPTERQALADLDRALAWNDEWRDAAVPYLVRVRRHWTSIAAQNLPERLRFDTPADVATFAGRARHWQHVSARVSALLTEWGATEAMTAAVRRHARAIAALDPADTARLGAVLRWLSAHPDSGLYIRQLPIRGVDTKWVKAHRGLVTALFAAISGRPSLGLNEPPELVRMRVLDRALLPISLTDFSSPVSELADLAIRPRTVFVFENLESVLAMEDVPGAVVVHGSGYAVKKLGDISWIREAPIVYWGDLDSHGYLILHRLRSHCSDVTSVLMDTATLETYQDLWVSEPDPTSALMSNLTPSEDAALTAVRSHGGIRMEQERIEWSTAMHVLRAAAQP